MFGTLKAAAGGGVVDQNEATTWTGRAGCALPVAAIWWGRAPTGSGHAHSRGRRRGHRGLGPPLLLPLLYAGTAWVAQGAYQESRSPAGVHQLGFKFYPLVTWWNIICSSNMTAHGIFLWKYPFQSLWNILCKLLWLEFVHLWKKLLSCVWFVQIINML